MEDGARLFEAVGSYLPRQASHWTASAGHWLVTGTLVSADISGFTALSERLAGHGREGAEELTILLNRCFGEMIDVVHARGGDVLKFGGDALLVLFTGADHAAHAAAAAAAMRGVIHKRWSTRLVSKVELGISQGLHSGQFSLHLVEGSHLELLVVGPAMSATVACEGAANRGEILMTAAAAALLDPAAVGERRPEGCLLSDAFVHPALPAARQPEAFDPRPFVPSWLLDPALTSGVAEHRQVAVAFVFFGEADRVIEEEGEAELHRRLSRLAEVVQEAASRHGAYWLASDVYPGGGKVIMSAGAPRSTGQDEDALVRALRAIVDSDVGLPLRAGMNRGPVFMGDLGSAARRTFTVMGDAVNLAARLMQKSRPGELVASRAVLDHVGTRFAVDPLEPFLVKGKSAPIEASLVGAMQSVEADDVALRDVPFCGRAGELALLQRLLDDTAQGHGHVVDLVGEAGIGKSRLVAELVASNPEFFAVRTSGGLYSRGSPYFAVRTMLRRIAGVSLSTPAAEAGSALRAWVEELDPTLLPWLPLIAVAFDASVPMTPEVERIAPANRAARLRDSVLAVLQAALRGPTVLIVEDAFWLDEASQDLFATLASDLDGAPWLLIALRREGTACFATTANGVTTIDLGPLPAEDTLALARAAIAAGLGEESDRIDELAERGGSNPLFVIELLRQAGSAGDAELPDSIETLVTARIDLLSAAERALLRDASVLGAVVDRALLAEALGDASVNSPERWTPLSSFFNSEAHGGLRFQHGLFRDVAYTGLPFRRRQQLHSNVGLVLEGRAGDEWEEFSELLSIHFDRAADWRRSWKYSVTAGDRARGKYANVEAAGFYSRALTAGQRCRLPREHLAAVAEALGDVSELAARYNEASVAYARARRHASDPVAGIRIMRKEGVVRERGGRYTQALRWYGRGLARVRQLADPDASRREEAQIALAYAGVRFRQGRFRDCLRWSHRAERAAGESGDDSLLAHAYYLLDVGYTALRDPNSAQYRDRALPLFERAGDLVGQANALNNLGLAARDEGRWPEALDRYERSRTARDLTGDVVGAATAANNIAEILSDQGHLDRAEALFNVALTRWRHAGYPIGVAVATSYLGRLHARRGQFDEARRLLREATARFETLQAGYFIAESRLFQAECELLEGNFDGCLEELAALVPVVEDVGDALLASTLLRMRAWAHHGAGDSATASRLASELIERARRINSPLELAYGLTIRAAAEGDGGRHSADDLELARSIFQDLGYVSLEATGFNVWGSG